MAINENITIEDDVLKQEDFDRIYELMTNGYFPWYFRYRFYAIDESRNIGTVEDELDQYQFTHSFYDDNSPQSDTIKQLDCLVKLLDPISICKIRANLLPRLPNIVENPFHSDLEDIIEEKLKHWTTSIFYMNTNNGYTAFEDGTKVESVANRLLTFPANMRHTGTNCTDQQIRIILNFNYFKKTL